MPCHGTASTHWEGKCWSRPLSWPWRSLQSVWEPAVQLCCSLFVAALGSDSPTPPWKPEKEEQKGKSWEMKHCQLIKKSKSNMKVSLNVTGEVLKKGYVDSNTMRACNVDIMVWLRVLQLQQSKKFTSFTELYNWKGRQKWPEDDQTYGEKREAGD